MGRGGELPDGGGEGPAAAGGGGGEMQDQEEEEEGVHPVRHVIARILFFGNFFFLFSAGQLLSQQLSFGFL